MKGNNSITLNISTVKEALQEWCDKHFIDSVKIIDVSPECEITVDFQSVKKDEFHHTADCLASNVDTCICGVTLRND